MDLGHWKYHQDIDVSKWYGFIYRIVELNTGKEYIGKKSFHSHRRKKIAGRKNRKRIVKESDWRRYTGSSRALNEQIEINGKENYSFTILSLHDTKGSLYYAEVARQVKEDVLRAKLPDGARKYYNGMIAAVKFLPPEQTLNEKAEEELPLSAS